jgi:hypothetical protein
MDYTGERLGLYCTETESENKQQIVDHIWLWINGVWQPNMEYETIPTGTGYFSLIDYSTNNHVDLSLLLDNTEPNNIVPLLAISQGIIAKKDLGVGGYISSQQGMLALGSGMHSLPEIPAQFGEPRISLLHSELNALHHIDDHPSESPEDGEMYISGGIIYKYDHTQEPPWVEFASASDYNYNFDTLHIYRFPNSHGHANLSCADIHSDGGIYTDTLKKLDGSNWILPGSSWNGGTITNNIIIRKNDAYLSLHDQSGTEKAVFYNYGSHTYLSSYLDFLFIHGGTDNAIVTDSNITINKSNPVVNFYDGTTFLGTIGGQSSGNYDFAVGAQAGNLYLGAYDTYVVINKHLEPIASPTWNGSAWINGSHLGDTTSFWNLVDAAYYYGKYTSIIAFDEHDDLALIKNSKVAKIGDLTVVDIDSLDLLKPDDWEHQQEVDMGKAAGLTIGALKQVATKLDVYDKAMSDLLSRLEKVELDLTESLEQKVSKEAM